MEDNPNKKTLRQNMSLQDPSQILVMQCYQCTCSKIFNTLNDYQYHFDNESHHQHPQQKPFIPDLNYQMHSKVPRSTLQSSINNPIIMQNKNKNHHEFSIPQKVNFQDDRNFLNNLIQAPPLSRFQNRHHQNQPYDEQSPFYHSQVQPQQEQQNFKYIDAYYASKLAPFYRQFDIDPQILSSKRNFYEQEDSYQFYQRNMRKSNNSKKFTRQSAASDLNKVLQQLGVRMIPVQNGIIDFIYTFSQENSQKISQINEQQAQKIYKILQESIQKLTIICYQNIREEQKANQYFMDSQMGFVIKMFAQFLREVLRKKQLYVAFLILIPIIQSIIELFQKMVQNSDINFKLVDLPNLLNQIKDSEADNKNNFSFCFDVTKDTKTQFLLWFTQWATMVQYVKNKWSIDYAQPLLDQINYINLMYQQNVKRYQRCVYQKRNLYAKTIRRKIIEKKKFKENQRKKQLNHLSKMSQRFGPHLFTIGDTNMRMREVSENNKQSNFPQFTNKAPQNPSYFPTQIQKKPENLSNTFEFEVIKKGKMRQNIREISISQKVDATSFYNSFDIRRDPRDPIYRYKNTFNPALQNEYMNSHLNSVEISERQEMDEDQINQAYVAVFKSQYVSYFSPESVELRRKEEQVWQQKVQKLNEIIKNPESFMSQIISQIPRQMEEVKQLQNLFRINLKSYKKDLQYDRHQYLDNENSHSIKRQGNSERRIFEKSSFQKDDPFIIYKNFRYRVRNYLNHPQYQIGPKYSSNQPVNQHSSIVSASFKKDKLNDQNLSKEDVNNNKIKTNNSNLPLQMHLYQVDRQEMRRLFVQNL